MASTTATHADIYSPPSLASLNVNDDLTVSGAFATIPRGRNYINTAKSGNGKSFSLVVKGPLKINIKRIS